MELAMVYMDRHKNIMNVSFSDECITVEVLTVFGAIEVEKFIDPKNALVEFLQYLLDSYKKITYVNLEVFRIPSDEIDWMAKHKRFKGLKKQLESFCVNFDDTFVCQRNFKGTKDDEYIVLYKDEFDFDVWDKYCKILGIPCDSEVLKIYPSIVRYS